MTGPTVRLVAPETGVGETALVLTGEVDPATVLSLRKQGEALIASASGPLTVDLGGLANAHSVVLSLLLCWQRCAQLRGLALSFRGVSDKLASLAALSNLDSELPGFVSSRELTRAL